MELSMAAIDKQYLWQVRARKSDNVQVLRVMA
jgi:hypothetical protein